MTVQHTPAPARSDLSTSSGTTAETTNPFRVHGLTLTVGAVTWAVAIAALGLSDHRLEHAGSGAFQIGLLALLRVLWRTRALGEGRWARVALRTELVILFGAMISTFGAVTRLDGDLDDPFWLVTDICWPVSMMGMFLIGIRIAVAGRWQGASRWWPMVAESWAVVTIPSMIVAGETGARVVGSAHLVVGYAVLGLIVSRKRG